jgi:hypothetical protein
MAASGSSDAVRPRKSVHCAMGVYCLNSRKTVFDLQERCNLNAEAASSSAAPVELQPKKITRGCIVPVSGALLNHAECFLPCGHFCCNWVPKVAYRVGAAAEGQCCATMHMLRCNKKGDCHFDKMWDYATEHGLFGTSRPRSVRANTEDYVTVPVSALTVDRCVLDIVSNIE